MEKLIVLFLVLTVFNQLEAKSKNNCNDQCQTKSLSLSKDGLIGCSGANCLMEASFRSSLINGQIVFNINLIGYDYASLKVPSYTIVLSGSTYLTRYSCLLGTYGADSSSATVTNGGRPYTNGSSQVRGGNLYCSWYMTFTDDIWPRADGVRTQLFSDSDSKISFTVDGKTFALASDISTLPIYHLQSLKCCHKVHGNDKYSLIVNQNDEKTEFFIQGFDLDTNIISVELDDSNGKKLVFDCYFGDYDLKGYLKTDTNLDDISSQISSDVNGKIAKCFWSIPILIRESFSTYDTKNGVYDLKISSDGEIAYTESNLSLKNFGLTKIPKLLMIFIPITIHLMIN